MHVSMALQVLQKFLVSAQEGLTQHLLDLLRILEAVATADHQRQAPFHELHSMCTTVAIVDGVELARNGPIELGDGIHRILHACPGPLVHAIAVTAVASGGVAGQNRRGRARWAHRRRWWRRPRRGRRRLRLCTSLCYSGLARSPQERRHILGPRTALRLPIGSLAGRRRGHRLDNLVLILGDGRLSSLRRHIPGALHRHSGRLWRCSCGQLGR
mmetsp:Transcript_64366/g.141911  ORF Transcript_64366/g.141911 Transcript_64366/m.141911 type:complete len:214 (-) Transcript_64366:2149-2790(-)